MVKMKKSTNKLSHHAKQLKHHTHKSKEHAIKAHEHAKMLIHERREKKLIGKLAKMHKNY